MDEHCKKRGNTSINKLLHQSPLQHFINPYRLKFGMKGEPCPSIEGLASMWVTVTSCWMKRRIGLGEFKRTTGYEREMFKITIYVSCHLFPWLRSSDCSWVVEYGMENPSYWLFLPSSLEAIDIDIQITQNLWKIKRAKVSENTGICDPELVSPEKLFPLFSQEVKE